MKLRTFMSVMTVLCVNFAHAQSGFEGVVTYNTTNASINEKATVTWYHKDGENRMDVNSHAGDQLIQYSMIMGTHDNSVFMISERNAQKISGINPDKSMTSATFIRKANTTEAGYNCEMLMFKTNGNDLTYWLTDEVGMTYENLPKIVRNNMPELNRISNGFTVKMELRDAGGNLLMSQVVESVKTMVINDSKFERK
jgi:hypothetical protein